MKFCPNCEVKLKQGDSGLQCPKCDYVEGKETKQKKKTCVESVYIPTPADNITPMLNANKSLFIFSRNLFFFLIALFHLRYPFFYVFDFFIILYHISLLGTAWVFQQIQSFLVPI